MAKNLDIITNLRDLLKEDQAGSLDIFQIFKLIGIMINNPDYDARKSEVQELILRLLDKRDQMIENEKMLIDSLARQIGLFPYLNENNLCLADLIAYEYHRPIGLENIVFHKVQAEVYRDLLSGQNVILSAPTSFGKSVIIDAIINLKKYDNILIVVPTIALIDETRRRLASYKEYYKIITHPNQKREGRNIFVLTQERVLEFVDDFKIDFIVIDEFYKINPLDNEDERSISLNQAFYKLLKSKAQFYLLGPNIEQISPNLEQISNIKTEIEFKFIRTDYRTVVTEYHYISTNYNELDKLVELTKSLDEQTLIYCRSPYSVNSVVMGMITSNKFRDVDTLDEAVQWMKDNYHESWLFAEALKKGIGIHHGKIPRSIAQFCVRAFNDNLIKYLVCTSTLIEGVNTSAKNVIIFDNKIAKKQIDYFTFNNIAGRSGRMFKHFIGNVYLFHEPPQSELPTVDFPLFSQTEDAPERLLIQIDDQDLNESSKHRLNKYKEQKILNFDTLRANSIAEPSYQIDLANKIMSDINYYHSKLCWSGVPTYDQLGIVCELIWNYLVRSKWSGGIRSGKELAIWIIKLMELRDVKKLIESETANYTDPLPINKRIENTLDFLRNWATYKFPRLLLVVESIQKEIFIREGIKHGNYSEFASMIENLFLDPTLMALDEYGIPTQISKKITPWIKPDGDLDGVIQRLKETDVNRLPLTRFEKDLIDDALYYL